MSKVEVITEKPIVTPVIGISFKSMFDTKVRITKSKSNSDFTLSLEEYVLIIDKQTMQEVYENLGKMLQGK